MTTSHIFPGTPSARNESLENKSFLIITVRVDLVQKGAYKNSLKFYW